MSKTYAQIQSTIADYCNRTDLTTQIQDAIDIVQRKLEDMPNKFRCMRNQESGQLVTDQNYIDFPSDTYKNTFSFFVKNTAGDYVKLQQLQIPWGYVDYPDPTGVTGLPEQFMIDWANEQIIFTPTPDDDYDYLHYYHEGQAALSTSNTTNWWSNNVWELLVYGALIELEPFLVNDDRMATWQMMYDKRVNELKAAEIQDDTSGSPQQSRPTTMVV